VLPLSGRRGADCCAASNQVTGGLRCNNLKHSIVYFRAKEIFRCLKSLPIKPSFTLIRWLCAAHLAVWSVPLAAKFIYRLVSAETLMGVLIISCFEMSSFKQFSYRNDNLQQLPTKLVISISFHFMQIKMLLAF
jgi:hypothetical protein